MTTEIDIFAQINNAVFDLQSADAQSYDRPLKTLRRLLLDAELQAANKKLTDGVDLDAFLAESKQQKAVWLEALDLFGPTIAKRS